MRIPAGKLYTPAALGIDALSIPLSSNADATIIPWCAGFLFRAVTFIIEAASGGAINLTLAVAPFDFDGQSLLSNPISLQTAMNGGLNMSFWGLDTARATTGAATATSIPVALGSPFARPRLQNLSAVDAVTVSLTIILHSAGFE